MHRERLEILRRRDVNVANAVPRKAQLEASVDSAGGLEKPARREPADVRPVVPIVRVVRDGEDDLVLAFAENAIWDRQLEWSGEPLSERDELAVHPCVDLVAHAVERKIGGR